MAMPEAPNQSTPDTGAGNDEVDHVRGRLVDTFRDAVHQHIKSLAEARILSSLRETAKSVAEREQFQDEISDCGFATACKVSQEVSLSIAFNPNQWAFSYASGQPLISGNDINDNGNEVYTFEIVRLPSIDVLVNESVTMLNNEPLKKE